MDPNTIIEALRGTMDPALREAAERQLNEVRTPGWRWRRRRAGGLWQAEPYRPGQRRGRRRRGAQQEGWGGDLTTSATPGPSGCCGSGGAGHGLRRILSWAFGCGGGMRGRLGRGGLDGLDTWLARVAGRPLAHTQLVRAPRRGRKSPGGVQTFPGGVLLAPDLEGLLGVQSWSTGGCACQLVPFLG